MRILLNVLAAMVTKVPKAVIVVLLGMTAGFAALATTAEFEVDLTKLGREGTESVRAMADIRERFGDPAAAIQVMMDAGHNGDMLSGPGLAALRAAEDIALDALGPAALTGADGRPRLLSPGAAIDAALTGSGIDPATAGEAVIGDVAGTVLVDQPQLMSLVSNDVDIENGRARAVMLVVRLDPGLTKAASAHAGEQVQAAFLARAHPTLRELRVTVFGLGLYEAGMLDAMRAEAPQLFAIALLVVLGILAFAYRSAFDVAIGFAGLVATVVWTFGFAALLGPAHLGWTGPLSQLAVIVPVLLVGLGIDYSMHLTARYREQRARGETAAVAARAALGTVGAALVLATMATATGFAATVAAPLRLLSDFGITVALGVVSAFVIMGLLVPAARVLRDSGVSADRGAQRPVRELRVARVMAGPVALATRAPVAGLAVAGVLMIASLIAAASLDTEFDRDDFIPEGTQISETLAVQSELFGAGVTEWTLVLIDRDVTEPSLADAIEQARANLGNVPGVRTVGGTGSAQVIESMSADGRAGLVQIRTTAGDGGAARLQEQVLDAYAPVAATGAPIVVTSEQIIIAEMSEELSRYQATSIGLTLGVVLALLIGYFGLTYRTPLLGAIAMLPAVFGASMILGVMWLLGMTFNALTATLTAIAIGIGVPYGAHVVTRFVENVAHAPAADAVAATLRNTGGAIAGSAVTTLSALVVLSFSGLPPIRSLGLLGGTGIAAALLVAVLVVPGVLMLWSRHGGQGTTAARVTLREHTSAR